MNEELEAAEAFIMPFGKHKGQPLAKIPLLYLHWLDTSASLRPPLQGHVRTLAHSKRELIEDLLDLEEEEIATQDDNWDDE